MMAVNKIRSNAHKDKDIYDVICYYDDQEDQEKGIQTVNDVIYKLAIDKRQRQRKHDDNYIKLKLLGCLLINVNLKNFKYSIQIIFYLIYRSWFQLQYTNMGQYIYNKKLGKYEYTILFHLII